MALQLILGGSGSGKSFHMYQELIESSMAHPEENFIIIVPEQYTLQTEKNLVMLHPRRGMMNIDIVSFGRLAYRIFEEQCVRTEQILDESGKRMVIRKLLEEHRQELTAFAGSIRKSGFCGELKSMISELIQYNLTADDLRDCMEQLGDRSVLYNKLHDLELIYRAFGSYTEGHYLTAEEIPAQLCPYLAESRIVRNSSIYLDNFTGFTPAQYRILRELLMYSPMVKIALTVDTRTSPYERKQPYELFYLTRDTIWQLEKLCAETGCGRLEDVRLLAGQATIRGRFAGSPDLAHLEQNIYRRKPQPYQKEPEHLFVYTAKDPRGEVDFIARRIRRYVRQEGLRYRDIAVICSDLSGYRHLIERSFHAREIPCFIDTKRSILENACVESLRALLEVFAWDFSYESIFRYLRSGFAGIRNEETDLLENYVLAYGIRGAKAWFSPWEKCPEQMSAENFEVLNRLREKAVLPIRQVYEAFLDPDADVRTRTLELLTWMEQSGMEELLSLRAQAYEQEGELSLAAQYARIYDVVTNLLQKFSYVLGEERLSVQEYIEILDAGLDEQKIGLTPPGIDEVMVGDIRRSRLDGIRVLFFAGVNEGLVPAVYKDGGILNDREKEQLEKMDLVLSPTGRMKGYFEQFYIYAALTVASDCLFLSCSQIGTDGKTLRSSSLIRRLEKVFPCLLIRDCEQEEDWEEKLCTRQDAADLLAKGLGRMPEQEPDALWKEIYGWYLRNPECENQLNLVLYGAFHTYEARPLSREAVRALYTDTLTGSVTTLEKYAACAYAHFLQYGLKLAPREESQAQAPDLGTILHRALELFARELKTEGYNWKDVPEPERERISMECTREAAGEYHFGALYETKRGEAQVQRLIRHVQRTTWAVKRQLERGDFLPDAFELRFDRGALADLTSVPLLHGRRMKLTGVIDRIDLCKTGNRVYVKIVDYKSGNVTFDPQALYEGLSLQLIIYLNAAQALEKKNYPDKEVIPAGILYYHISDPVIERLREKETSAGAKDGKTDGAAGVKDRKTDGAAGVKDGKTDGTDKAIEEGLLKQLRGSGLIQADPEVIRLLDSTISSESLVIPVRMNRSGTLSKVSKVATAEQFKDMGAYAAGKAQSLGNEILSGNIAVNPYVKGDKKACTFCPYGSVCGFDRKVQGYEYRVLQKKMDPEQVWQLLHAAVSGTEAEDLSGTWQSGRKQSGTEPSGLKQSHTEQSKPKQSSAEQGSAMGGEMHEHNMDR